MITSHIWCFDSFLALTSLFSFLRHPFRTLLPFLKSYIIITCPRHLDWISHTAFKERAILSFIQRTFLLLIFCVLDFYFIILSCCRNVHFLLLFCHFIKYRSSWRRLSLQSFRLLSLFVVGIISWGTWFLFLIFAQIIKKSMLFRNIYRLNLLSRACEPLLSRATSIKIFIFDIVSFNSVCLSAVNGRKELLEVSHLIKL